MEVFDPTKPVIRGRASIIHSGVEVKVFWKRQLDKAISWLVENEFEFDWEVEKGDSIKHDIFKLNVYDIAWANNLGAFAKVLEDCDYKDLIDEEETKAEISFVDQTLQNSKRIKNGRTRYAVLAKAQEELGELAQEVMISQDDHYKPEGKDGIIGEAIDLMVCCIDIIYGVNPNITEAEMQVILKKKLAKWVEKSELQNPGSTS
jgi:hypothetical protein